MQQVNIYEIVGKNIKNIRLEKGLTQQYLAQSVGITLYRIKQIEENPKPRILTIDIIYRISVVLKVSIKEMFKNDEKYL